MPLSEYRLRRRVQFHETDVAGIVHFSWFFRYMEEAEHALWREAGLSIHPPDSDIGWPRVAASCDFHGALRFEDEFDVSIRVPSGEDRKSTRLNSSHGYISYAGFCLKQTKGGGSRSVEGDCGLSLREVVDARGHLLLRHGLHFRAQIDVARPLLRLEPDRSHPVGLRL